MSFYVDVPSFEEQLKNDLIISLNSNGVKQVKELVDEKDKEIERLKDRIARANNFIDQEIMYLVKPKDYNKIEMLQDILNDNDFAKGK